jgi:hypothetical protein
MMLLPMAYPVARFDGGYYDAASPYGEITGTGGLPIPTVR